MKTLEQILIESIEKVGDATGQAVDFAIEQAPVAVQQALSWYLTQSIFYFVVGLGLLLVTQPIYKYFSKRFEDSVGHDGEGWLTCKYLITTTLALVGIFMFIINLLEALKIWIAPKLWLIEYAASLAKPITS